MNASTTVFVDGMATRVPTKSASEAVALCQTVAAEIDRALEAVGAAQNSDKQESLARLRGVDPERSPESSSLARPLG